MTLNSEHTCVHRRARRPGLCAVMPAGTAGPYLSPPTASPSPPARAQSGTPRRCPPLSYRQRDTVAVARSLVARFSCHALFFAEYGDGLNNYEEIKIHRTDPCDPDSNNNGFPDGTTESEWLSHPAWAGSSTNLIITLTQSIPSDAKAALIVPHSSGNLCIPLCNAQAYLRAVPECLGRGRGFQACSPTLPVRPGATHPNSHYIYINFTKSFYE